MKNGVLLFNKDTGEPVLVVIGYSDEEVNEYIEGRKLTENGNLGAFKVKCMEKRD